MKQDSKVFIAGHTGLIGSALVEEFRACGYTNQLLATHDELDLSDSIKTRDFFDLHRPDYVILAAGKVGGIRENQEKPAEFLATNLKIQLNVLECAHTFSVRSVVMFGSSCMYPKTCGQPMAEEALLSGMPEPTSLPYAMAKLSGLQLCLSYNKQYNKTRFIPVIPNSVYGPNDNFDPETGHVLSALLARFSGAKEQKKERITLWGTGEARREFVYSSDVAKAVRQILEADFDTFELPINIGTGTDHSIKELAEEISELVGFEGEIEWDHSKPNGALRKLLDSSRVRKIGWSPEVDLRDGLRKTYQWYRER